MRQRQILWHMSSQISERRQVATQEKKKSASLAEQHGNSTYFIGFEHGSQSQWMINILTLEKGDGSKLIIGNYFKH